MAKFELEHFFKECKIGTVLTRITAERIPRKFVPIFDLCPLNKSGQAIQGTCFSWFIGRDKGYCRSFNVPNVVMAVSIDGQSILEMHSDMNFFNCDFRRGAVSAIPIFIGYFTASTAFGLLARGAGLSGLQSILFSATNLTGAAQFLAINLIASGAFPLEIVFSIFLINLRYFLMTASLLIKVKYKNNLEKYLAAFAVTDEVFSVAMVDSGNVNVRFMAGLQLTSWSGWVLGTVAGFFAGTFLPPALSAAMQVALFALFAALLVPEIKKDKLIAFLTALGAALLNTFFYYVLKLSAGWSLAIAMIIASLAATIFLSRQNALKKSPGEREFRKNG
ncbi:MAG: AzlC family ABC transporter permease [Desulfuromonadaceae bacterium]|nr:AzlC family ABC transporter permease [Desulfuromonadaceae bacterium]